MPSAGGYFGIFAPVFLSLSSAISRTEQARKPVLLKDLSFRLPIAIDRLFRQENGGPRTRLGLAAVVGASLQGRVDERSGGRESEVRSTCESGGWRRERRGFKGGRGRCVYLAGWLSSAWCEAN